jgi:DNA-binding transcriptional MerR regulator
MDWSINDVARMAGTTSRTLRHYGDVGLLEPTRIGPNGYRYYDERALTRLQRILMLRALGLGIPAVAQVLEGESNDAPALRNHLVWLRAEKARLDRQIGSVETTITRLEHGEHLMAEDMFDGFDHTAHKREVEHRWGSAAYAEGDRWWRSMSEGDRAEWATRNTELASDWIAAAASGMEADGTVAQALAQRQADWLSSIPGTPGAGGVPTKEYFVGLGELYVADDRFAANYGGTAGAEFVRDAMRVYADRRL